MWDLGKVKAELVSEPGLPSALAECCSESFGELFPVLLQSPGVGVVLQKLSCFFLVGERVSVGREGKR